VDDVILLEQRLSSINNSISSTQTDVDTLNSDLTTLETQLTVSPVIIPDPATSETLDYVVQIAAAAANTGPTLSSVGPVGDVGLKLASKGNGTLSLIAPTTDVKHIGGGRYISMVPSVAGTPSISSAGITNTPLEIKSTGSANIILTPGTTGLVQLKKFVCAVTYAANATQTVADNATISFANASKVTWDTLILESYSGAFDNPNDTIIVPFAGIYRIRASLKCSDAGSIAVFFAKNGSQLGNPKFLSLNSGSYGGYEISRFVSLAANDAISIYVLSPNAGEKVAGDAFNALEVQRGDNEFSVEYISS
jgi:hypothetical protein